MGVADGRAHVGDMLFQGLAELAVTVLLAALGEQIDDPPAGTADPVHALPAVDEAQHLDATREVAPLGPVDDLRHRIGLAAGDPRRGHLDAIDPHQFQQCLGEIDLFVRRKGHALGLLAVAQGGVHDEDVAAGLAHAGASSVDSRCP